MARRLSHTHSVKGFERLRGIDTDLREALDRMAALQSFPLEISEAKTRENVYNCVFSVVPKLVDCLSARIYKFNEDHFVPVEETVYLPKAMPPQVDGEVIAWCCERRKPMVLPETDLKSGLAIVPMAIGDRQWGAIVLDLGEQYALYSEITSMTLSTLAHYAAISLTRISDQNQMQDNFRTLQTEIAYQQRLLREFPGAVVVVDGSGIIRALSRSAESLLEVREKIVLGNSFRVGLPGNYHDLFAGILSEAIHQEKTFNMVESFTTVTGMTHRVAIHVAPLEEEGGGNKKGVICFMQPLN